MKNPKFAAGLLIVMMSGVVAAALAGAEGGEAAERQKFVGVWKGFTVEGRGENPDRGPVKLELRITEKAIKGFEFKGANIVDHGEGEYVLDLSQSPKHLDAAKSSERGRSQSYVGIYALDGDTLKWCVSPQKVRPETFETKKGQFLLILKRQPGEAPAATPEQKPRPGQAEPPRAQGERADPAARRPAQAGREKTGMVPLCDMSANDRYKNEDGGLYGQGRNVPPAGHAAAARKELAQIQPLDAAGKPASDGKIVLLSIGMSNTAQEYRAFMAAVQAAQGIHPRLVLADGAAASMDVTLWAENQTLAAAGMTPWELLDKRLGRAGVTAKQVQVVWLKQAKMGPAAWGEFPAHARKLADGMATILQRAKERLPNLRVAYLSSRTYAGYAATPLNPEPYAYESGFAVRWLIQEQMQGNARLNFDPAKGAVRCPLLLWGPYLWTDGVNPRRSDNLTWTREDAAPDGTHPSKSGQEKVAKLLLDFFRTDELARGWFLEGK